MSLIPTMEEILENPDVDTPTLSRQTLREVSLYGDRKLDKRPDYLYCCEEKGCIQHRRVEMPFCTIM